MNNQKSSLSVWNSTSQTIVTNSSLNFLNYQKTGCSIKFNSGSASINLAKPGLYYVTLSATGVEGGTAGDITIQMFNNGIAVPGATASENSATTTSIVNLGFSSIILVKPSCPTTSNSSVLTFVNTGVGATYSNVIANVFKLA